LEPFRLGGEKPAIDINNGRAEGLVNTGPLNFQSISKRGQKQRHRIRILFVANEAGAKDKKRGYL